MIEQTDCLSGRRCRQFTVPVFFLVWIVTFDCLADVRLASVFSDHMVLQQGKKIAVWGSAGPGQKVEVRLGTLSSKTVADQAGQWFLHLDPQPAGGPRQLIVSSGKESVSINDVLIGEVWLCSGQSNMQFALQSVSTAAVDVAGANHTMIRLLQVPRNSTLQAATEFDAKWRVCTPESAAGFSAVAYYFGLGLQKRLKVPVGLIASSWGGTNAEEWTSAEFLSGQPEYFEAIHRRWEESNPENQRFFSKPFPFDLRLDDVKLIPASNADPESLIDDFNDGDLQAESGGTWRFWPGSPRLSLEVTSQKELAVAGGLSPNDQVSLELRFGQSEAFLDLSAYTAVSFRLRGKGFVKLHTLQPSISDGDHYVASPVAATDDWQTVRIEFDSLRQAGWGVRQPFTRNSIAGLLLEVLPGLWPVVRPPSGLYNGMICPLVPYTLSGFAWYQGEGNAGRSFQYRKLLPALIASWRSAWTDRSLPFLVVQLPNYRPRVDQPQESGWAELREAQFQTMRTVPNVGLAVTIDQGQAEDVHPRKKSEVGRRLGLWALGRVYKQPLVYSGPLVKSWRKHGRTIRVKFEHTGSGLVAAGGSSLRGFAVAGPDRKFHWADAQIKGDEVILSSRAVGNPVAVRYAWADNPECNLYNREGLPASPFRTDDWPGVTFSAR